MKERNNLNNKEGPTSTTSSSTSNETTTDAQNFLSPYNSNNFMAPPIGGTIRCVTCLGNTVQGKVIAYDQQTKMLALSKLFANYFSLLNYLNFKLK